MSVVTEIVQAAKAAAPLLAQLSTDKKNQVLKDMANRLRERKRQILEVNEQEVMQARDNGLDAAMLDRLTLTEARIDDMASGIEVVASLDDPVGQERLLSERPNGIVVKKRRIPLGVICMIYEARPNVTADAGALCFKSGNAVILRGGKEALASSLCIASCLQEVLRDHNLPEALISVVPDPDRALMLALIQQRGGVDLVIPRGGEGLIHYVSDNARVPVIQHFKGVCHLYVDVEANLEKALALLMNGKLQRTGVCNALECLVVHREVAADFLPIVAEAFAPANVRVHADKASLAYFPNALPIDEDGYGQEYLGPEIAVRIVNTYDDAIEHIARFGSQHTEVICTENKDTARDFLCRVDASVVMVNASSRFSDGSQLGLGAEIGIATTKLHAYGPMGLESLTTEKYLVEGTGQVRE